MSVGNTDSGVPYDMIIGSYNIIVKMKSMPALMCTILAYFLSQFDKI